MKKRFLLFTATIGSLVTLSAFTLVLNSSGKIFYTGSPYDGSTCSDCHSGGATIPAVTITAVPAFGTGDTYVPSTTYTVSVNATGSYNKYGFDMEILDSNSPTAANDAGTFGAMASGNCQKFTFPNSPTNVTHTTPSGSAGSATFSYEWTAPASGTVFMYTAVLGVNLNGSTSGDRVKTFSYTLTPSGVGMTENADTGIKLNAFPNPVSDRLTVSYELKQESRVCLAIYSLSGAHISDLVKETQLPGAKSVEVRIPEGTAKGAYLLKLFVNGGESSQKLIIL